MLQGNNQEAVSFNEMTSKDYYFDSYAHFGNGDSEAMRRY